MALGCLSCHSDVDLEQRGLFIIDNQSGHDVTLQVFSTKNRQKAPLLLLVPQGGKLERTVEGGAGAISYPELYVQGDSVRLVFNDGKQLLHYCTEVQQLSGQCTPAHNVFVLSQYRAEPVSKNVTKYTYLLAPLDYNTAR